jgi:GNAT superfamily N-acetyltransferase
LAVYEKSPDSVVVSMKEMKEAGFGENPVWKAFVVTDNDVIIGFAMYYMRYSTWNGRRIYLEDLIVTEKYRGKGYGKMLFNRIIQEVKDKNYNGFVWQVLDWNEPAIKFYEKYEAEFEANWFNCCLVNKEQIVNK